MSDATTPPNQSARESRAFRYSQEEWLEHTYAMRDLFRAYVSKDISYELAIYFQSRYSNPKEGQYKYECFARAIAFYVSHRDDFDIGEIAVKGSVESGDLVSSRVVEALYRWFAASQWPQTIPDPSIDVILRMVRGEE